jgi:hypothetical protein
MPENARPFPPELKAEADKIVARLGELRGTPAKAPVSMFLVGRKEAVSYYRDSIDDGDRREAALQEDVYQLLGLVPAGTSIIEALLSLLNLGILGFYDPDHGALFLVDDLGGLDSAASRSTVVHELTHALQDQYYDLKKLQAPFEQGNDWDGYTAYLNAVEGDAVVTEGAYRESSSQRAPCFQIPPVVNLPGIPFVLQRELRTRYEDGYCYVKNAAPRLEDHAALYARLPSTTEQVLHPEKYRDAEAARPVQAASLGGLVAEGWQEVARGNLGEFTMQNLLVLGLRNDRPAAQRGAEGWGGDAWVLYSRGETRLLELATVWDSPAQAREFFDVLRESFSNRSGSDFLGSDQAVSMRLEANWLRAGLAGDRVTIVSASDRQAADAAAASLGIR